MTRTLLRFSSFAFVLLWATAVHAQSTNGEISFSSTAIGRTTLRLEGQLPLTFSFETARNENFKALDGEEAPGKIRWLELMSWNYIGHDPRQFRHYGPTTQDFPAALGNDGTINSADTGILMIAIRALKKRTADLMKVRAENTELKVRIEATGRVALSIKLLWG
jgi:hypothetical protein